MNCAPRQQGFNTLNHGIKAISLIGAEVFLQSSLKISFISV